MQTDGPSGVTAAGRSRSLVVSGWILVVLVAVLMVLAAGRHEVGPAIVFALVGIAMGIWTWKRWSRAATLTALVLGLVWTLQFVAYAVAGATEDPFDVDIFVVDLIGSLAGILIVAGSIQGIAQAKRAPQSATP